uniref:Uncharacterized protein n=1 Tax=Anguilla anguilla TaxID=7936 RepID=A0A0E9RMJ6_ANGAN
MPLRLVVYPYITKEY